LFSRKTNPAPEQPSTDEAKGLIETAAVNEPRQDPLAASLTYLAAHHGRAVSREALLGGLPILDGRLSVALYDRGAPGWKPRRSSATSTTFPPSCSLQC
jgi:ATP-binding cassette subfamily C protein LapB